MKKVFKHYSNRILDPILAILRCVDDEYLYIIIFTVMLWLSLWAVNTFASIPKACNQQLYDAIFKEVTQEAMAKYDLAIKAERDASMKKAENIESLRKLCNGQRSTLETGEKQ